MKSNHSQRKKMNARIITALLTLLGFGTACTGVKETAKSSTDGRDSIRIRIQHPIRLMYGVPARDFHARPFADTLSGAERPRTEAQISEEASARDR